MQATNEVYVEVLRERGLPPSGGNVNLWPVTLAEAERLAAVERKKSYVCKVEVRVSQR